MIHFAQKTFSFLYCVRYGLMVPNVEIVAVWWAHPGIYTPMYSVSVVPLSVIYLLY